MIMYAFSALFCLLIVIFGVQMVMSQYHLGQETATMQWPEWIYGLFVPFGAVFMTIRFAQVTIEEIRCPAEKTESDAAFRMEAAAEEAKEYKEETEK
jgi:C4-dicarboxylate transporter DctQ subunit